MRCARKWVGRCRLEGESGLCDRSSAPKRVANRTGADRVEAIAKLRRLRFTAGEIAETLGMALSTVSGILTRLGMGKLGRLGLEQPVRYERSRPGELVHIDIKKLGRIQGGAGWRLRAGQQHYNPTITDKAGKRRNTVGYEYVHIGRHTSTYANDVAKKRPPKGGPPTLPATSSAPGSCLSPIGFMHPTRADVP